MVQQLFQAPDFTASMAMYRQSSVWVSVAMSCRDIGSSLDRSATSRMYSLVSMAKLSSLEVAGRERRDR